MIWVELPENGSRRLKVNRNKQEPMFDWDMIDRLIQRSLQEDLGSLGDITSQMVISNHLMGWGTLMAKEDGVIGGLPIAKRIFQKVDGDLEWTPEVSDGESVRPGQMLANIKGRLASIFAAERVVLNFLQHLSGIATLTSKFVSVVEGLSTTILDTRKTIPQMRLLEKYAVTLGGGANHRFGLFDMVLIKDNHIIAAGGIDFAIQNCLTQCKKFNKPVRIEVETKSLQQVKAVLKYPVDRVMLDNMDYKTMKQAVKLIDRKIEVEASGNVTLETVRKVAETGVDFISIGALTHSPKALDIALDLHKL